MKLFINNFYETNLSIYYCSLKLRKENRISGLQKGNFHLPSSAPEARKEARVSPAPHHTLNEERSARFTTQRSPALCNTVQ